MPYMKDGKRDYKKEYKLESDKRKKERSNRNKARVIMNLKNGDPRVVHHKDGNALNNNKSNLKVVSKATNDAAAKKAKQRKS